LKEKIKEIFTNWDETLIWSCLQGVMGEIHTNATQDAAMAILGDFAFFAGKPDSDLVRFKPENCNQDFIILVPQSGEWARLIEEYYGNKARKVTRYAIKKEKDIFDIPRLEQVIMSLPEEYELKMLEMAEFELCQKNA